MADTPGQNIEPSANDLIEQGAADTPPIGRTLTDDDLDAIVAALQAAGFGTSRLAAGPLMAWDIPPGQTRNVFTNKLNLGVGDRCDTLLYLTDGNATPTVPVDLTGLTVQGRITFVGVPAGDWVECTIEDAAGGRVSYSLQAADTIAAGSGTLTLIATNGTDVRRTFRGPDVQVTG